MGHRLLKAQVHNSWLRQFWLLYDPIRRWHIHKVPKGTKLLRKHMLNLSNRHNLNCWNQFLQSRFFPYMPLHFSSQILKIILRLRIVLIRDDHGVIIGWLLTGFIVFFHLFKVELSRKPANIFICDAIKSSYH